MANLVGRSAVTPLAAVEGGLSRQGGGRTVWGRAGQRGAMGAGLARNWRAAVEYTGRGSPLEAHRNRTVILAAIEAKVDITLVELAGMLRNGHGAFFAPSTIWRFLDRHAMTVKKIAHASEQERIDVATRRKAWAGGQPSLDPARLVFIDETGASTKMARLYGRSKRGRRCLASVPHGHWKTTTFTGALRATGMNGPMVLDGRGGHAAGRGFCSSSA